MKYNALHVDFEENAARYPDRVAVEEPHRLITYRRLNAAADRAAWLLKDAGVTRGTYVPVLMPSGVGLVASMLSVFKAGGVYLPLDLSFAKRRMAQIFAQTAARVVITSPALLEPLNALLGELGVTLEHLILLDEENGCTLSRWENQAARPVAGDDRPEAFPRINEPEDGNYILYTSGSTGEGKAILGRHKGLAHFIHWEIKEFGFDHNVRVGQLSQVTFDPSFRDIMVPLCAGGTLCIPPAAARTNILGLIRWIDRSQVNVLHCVPSLFRLITNDLPAPSGGPGVGGGLTHILLAGEMLFAKDVQNWRDKIGNRVQLMNLYGPTETTHSKAFRRIGALPENLSEAIPVGKPISDAFLAVVNDGKLCRPGEIGEIYIKTPYMTKGYPFNPELQAAAFVPNPISRNDDDILYKTGDLGRYLADFSVEIVGRLDDQVKINGIRVELQEIVQAALRVEGVRHAVVVPHRNHDGVQELICYYISPSLTEDGLRAGLKNELNANLIPSYFIRMDAFPLNLNGKVDKKALPLPQAPAPTDQDYEAPVGEVERKMAALWATVLGVKQVGRNTSFFSVGGHSIKALQLVSALYKELGADVKLTDIFQYPTIAQLAARIALRHPLAGQMPKAGEQAHYLTSHSQKQLWIMDQYLDNRSAYNMFMAYTLEGPLDVPVFNAALGEIIRRHEVLRTTFAEVNGEPVQVIHPFETAAIQADYIDLQGEGAAPGLIDDLIAREVARPFDLGKGPLLRVRLMREQPEKVVFLLTVHHIIFDGWSIGVFIDELLALYNGRVRNQPAALPPPPVQYKDYAAWQSLLMQSEAFPLQKQYWENKLTGATYLDLPLDFPRPETHALDSDHLRFCVDPDLAHRLRELARENQVSSFTVAIAVVTMLLHRYTGKTSIVLGTTVSGRDHPQLDRSIGFFVNTIALKLPVHNQDSFLEVLQKAKTEVLESFENQAYPFDILVESLGQKRQKNRSPLFDVEVNFYSHLNLNRGREEMEGLRASVRVEKKRETIYDLSFSISEEETGLYWDLVYNQNLFSRQTIADMSDRLLALMAAVAADPQAKANEIGLLPQTESAVPEPLFFARLNF